MSTASADRFLTSRGAEGVDAGWQILPGSTELPLELAFLPSDIVSPVALYAAAQVAAAEQVSADRALVALGHLSTDRYYRLLAAQLGLPFADQPLRPAAGETVAGVLQAGLLRLAPNPRGWAWLIAPSGTMLRYLLGAPPGERSDCAVTTPDRLEALIRHQHRTAIAHQASLGLASWNGALSAHGGLTKAQAAACAGVMAALSVMACVNPLAALALLSIVFYCGFFLHASLRVAATAASRAPGRPAPPLPPDEALPVYTVVVPLYREAREVERLTDALGRLDYPRAKLDVILMIEANDRATLRALDRRGLPGCYRVIMAPAGTPQTKPRALNIALQFARGSFLVVYDAEDDPEPGQLRTALAGFAADPHVACLQAQLAIDNYGDGWLTRVFALEYAALFHVVNPGLAALRLPIALGGTSNHFRVDVLRRVNGWDAWNVTEDIDLGIRLARFGHRVGTIASTTFEEAPRTLRAWLAQRRRWQKGWIVTLLTHSRHPLRSWRELGARGGWAVSAMLIGTLASSLLGPFGFAHLALRLWSGVLLHPRSLTDILWNAMSCLLFVVGAVSVVWPVWRGLERRRLRRLLPWTLAIPLYFGLLTIASWQALFEMAWRPYFWAKTDHGNARRRLGASVTGASA